jgi:hypothetical protein
VVLILVLSVVVALLGAAQCVARTRVTSLAELERELAVGDLITVVPDSGMPVAGRVLRVTPHSLEIRPVEKRVGQGAASRIQTISLSTIQSLERRRDPVRNGALIGAAAGASAGGAMFLTAFAIDRNEMDEWAPFYLGATAVSTGLGAVIGWAVDAARSKPRLWFEPSGRSATLRVQAGQRRVAVGLALAF